MFKAQIMLGAAVQRYVKGARYERELINILYSMGYSVIRSAGSGVSSLSPDILAIRDGVCLSIECKAWENGSLSLDDDGYGKLRAWEGNTKSQTFIGWRMNGKGWYFIRLEEFSKAVKNWNITRKRTIEINRKLEDVIAVSMQSRQLPGT